MPEEKLDELWGRLDFHATLLEATLEEMIPLLDRGRVYAPSLPSRHAPALRSMLREALALWPLLQAAVGEIQQVAGQLAWLGVGGAPRLQEAAQSTERALVEVSPLVRLGEAVLKKQIDMETAARAGSVLSEALLFHRTMKAALGELHGAATEARAALLADRGAA